MSEESPETKDVQEQQKELVKKFNNLDKPQLIQYEEENKELVENFPLPVARKFEDKWERFMGTTYYSFLGKRDMRPEYLSKRDSRIDPKSCNYRVPEPFNRIEWLKDEYFQKIGKNITRTVDRFYITIFHAETKQPTVLAKDLFEDQLPLQLGKKVAEQILKEANDKEYPKKKGKVEGEFEFNVLGYWEVRFDPKRNPHDPNEVILPVEGVCLQIERDKPVILPGNFLEAADNGVHPTFIQLPDVPRKVTGHIKHFPYMVLRASTRKEYEEALAAGNKKQKEARELEERIA